MKKIGLILTVLTSAATIWSYGEPAFNKPGANFPGDSSEYLNPMPVGEIRKVQTLSATKKDPIEYPDIRRLGTYITASMKELSKNPQFKKALQKAITKSLEAHARTNTTETAVTTSPYYTGQLTDDIITSIQQFSTDPQAKQALQDLIQMVYNAHTAKITQEAASEESIMNMYHIMIRTIEACFDIEIDKTARTETDRGNYKRN